MSNQRFSRIGYPKDASGKHVCRWCRGPVGPGRRTFCSDECVEQFKIRKGSGWVRAALFRRDRGICALCGVDTVLARRRAVEWRQTNRPPIWGEQRFRDELGQTDVKAFHQAEESYRQTRTAALGADWPDLSRVNWWDADHILEVCRGGGECGLTNFQTLCVPCHRAKTRRLAAERAVERKLARLPIPTP